MPQYCNFVFKIFANKVLNAYYIIIWDMTYFLRNRNDKYFEVCMFYNIVGVIGLIKKKYVFINKCIYNNGNDENLF